MEEIKNKIKEFLNYSLTANNGVGWEGIKAKLNVQDKYIHELKVLAKANNTLLGRIITFPHADSSAMYIITKINKKSVQLTWVDYCDAWVDGRLGKLGSVAIWYAKERIDNIDLIEKTFPARVTFS